MEGLGGGLWVRVNSRPRAVVRRSIALCRWPGPRPRARFESRGCTGAGDDAGFIMTRVRMRLPGMPTPELTGGTKGRPNPLKLEHPVPPCVPAFPESLAAEGQRATPSAPHSHGPPTVQVAPGSRVWTHTITHLRRRRPPGGAAPRAACLDQPLCVRVVRRDRDESVRGACGRQGAWGRC